MKKINICSDMLEVSDVADIQKMLYALMKEFHSICEEYGLYYVVFGGTMLGVVRHQAMIPWDDDIDVCMPRDDYKKFCEIVNTQYSDKFTALCYPQDNYIYSYGKFCLNNSFVLEEKLLPAYAQSMLYIDVFPIDGYPNSKCEKKHFDRLRFYHKAQYFSLYKMNFSPVWWKKSFAIIRFIHFLPYRLIGYKYFIKKELQESKKFDFESCEYVSMQGAGWQEKGKLLKETFLNRKLYKFGNLEVWGISDYDEHLTKLYGDYLTPPPKEKQISNHSYKLYIKKEDDYER